MSMWKDLDIRQKSEIMRMAVSQGITDLNEIKKMYDASISGIEASSVNNTYSSVPYNPSSKDVRYDDGGRLAEVIITPDRDYNIFLNSLPPNQKYGDSSFNTYRYWELHGKPADFEAALKTNPPMYTLEDDGYYHASSVAYNRDNDTYEFMKSPDHPTVDLELLQYWNNPELNEFRNNYGLDLDSNPYKYIRRGTTNKPLYAYGGPMGNVYGGKGNKNQKMSTKRKSASELMWAKAQPMYNEIIGWDTGLSNAAIAGILGNIGLESSFDYKASNGTHHGYLQNQDRIRDFIIQYYGGYGHKEQMRYLKDGLTGNLRGKNTSMGQQLQRRFNNYITSVASVTDPVLASQLWEKYYEISGGQAMGARQRYASHFYDQMPQPTFFEGAKNMVRNARNVAKASNDISLDTSENINFNTTNNPVYHTAANDLVWHPSIQPSTQPTTFEDVNGVQKPLVIVPEPQEEEPFTFDKFWDNLFSNKEQQVEEYVPSVYEQYMTLSNNTRRTPLVTPQDIQQANTGNKPLLYENKYMLFEPIKGRFAACGGNLNKFGDGGHIKGSAKDGSRDIWYNPDLKRWEWGNKKVALPSEHRVKLSDGYEYQLNDNGTKTRIGKKPSTGDQRITRVLHNSPSNDPVDAILDTMTIPLDQNGTTVYNGLYPFMQSSILVDAPLYAARTGDMSRLTNDTINIPTATFKSNRLLPKKLMPFYTVDSLYLPTKFKDNYNILNKGIIIDKDKIKENKSSDNIPFTYDAGHHNMQIRNEGGKYVTDFSDVFDTNVEFFDSRLNPIIFSQYNIPTVFTNDTTLLNRNRTFIDEVGAELGNKIGRDLIRKVKKIWTGK